jgi:hypothetical protein
MFGRLVTQFHAIGRLHAARARGSDLWPQSATAWPGVSRLEAASTAAPVNGCP